MFPQFFCGVHLLFRWEALFVFDAQLAHEQVVDRLVMMIEGCITPLDLVAQGTPMADEWLNYILVV
jgi:hypothetical protein